MFILQKANSSKISCIYLETFLEQQKYRLDPKGWWLPTIHESRYLSFVEDYFVLLAIPPSLCSRVRLEWKLCRGSLLRMAGRRPPEWSIQLRK
mmetsp:Transcript_13081/g.38459  ORF Transcript_13081/g.38459 Transcript_13081/m.38459 type:complete len:93 (+) Transcript_13081:1431-1709(+)